MSSIDERIVEMRFENGLFEKNVATSIGTLEKLKTALNFDKATESFNNVERSISAADFSRLENSIDSIKNKFSTFGIAGMTVIQDLTRAAERFGVKLYNATLGQIKTGGWNRATNIDKARFSIEGLGYAFKDLEGSINKAVTGTRFGFDEAATAASQLVASNVKIGEEMDNALMSIANVASQTNSEYSEIGHIYTTIAGNGKLMTEQLNQFSYRGLNAAAMLGKALDKTESEIREMTSDGEISFKMFSDAMNKALGEGAKRANDTFEGSLANMKAALSRVGQPFAKSYRDAMIPIHNAVKTLINDINGTRIKEVAEIFDDFAQKASHLFVEVLSRIDVSWLDYIVNGIKSAYNVFDSFMTKLTPFWTKVTSVSEEVVNTTKAVTDAAINVEEMANRVIRGDFGNGEERRKALAENFEIIQNKVNEMLGCTYRYDVAEQQLTESVKDNSDAVSENAEKVEESTGSWNKQLTFIENAKNTILSWPEKIKNSFNAIVDKDTAIGKLATMVAGLKSILGMFGKMILSVIDSAVGPLTTIVGTLLNLLMSLGSAIGSLFIFMTNLFETSGTLQFLRSVVDGVFNAFSNLVSFIGGGLSAHFDNMSNLFMTFSDSLSNVKNKLSSFWEGLNRTDEFHNLHNAFGRLKRTIGDLKSKGFDALRNSFEKIKSKFNEKGIKLPTSAFKALGKAIRFVADKIADFLNFITSKIDVNALIEKLSAGIEGFVDILLNLGTIVGGAVSKAFEFLSVKLSNLYKWVEENKDGFKDFFTGLKDTGPVKAVSSALESINGGLGSAKDGIVDFIRKTAESIQNGTFEFPTFSLDGVKQSIEDFYSWVLEKFGSIRDTVVEWFTGLKLPKLKLPTVIKGVKDTKASINNELLGITGSITEESNSIESALGGVTDAISLLDTVSEVFDFIKNAIFQIYALKGFMGIMSGLWNLSKLFKRTAEAVEEVKSVFTSIKGFIGSVSGVFNKVSDGIERVSKAVAKNESATALLKIAGAVAIVAAAFYALSTISWDQFKVAAASIGVITLALVILSAAISKLTGSKAAGGSPKDNAIHLLGEAIKELGENIGKGLSKLGTAAMILSFVQGVRTILNLIIELKDFSWADAKNGIKIMGAVMAELVLAILALTKFGDSSFGQSIGQAAMILALTIALKSIANSLIKLSEIDPSSLKRAKNTLVEIAAVIGLISIFSTGKLKKGNTQKKASLKPYVGMIASVVIITLSLVALSLIPKNALEKAKSAITQVGLVLTIMSLAFSHLTKTINKQGKDSYGAAILGMIVTFGLIVAAFLTLSQVDGSQMEFIADSLSKVIAAISLLSLVLGILGKLNLNAEMVLAGGGGVLAGSALFALIGLIASLIGSLQDVGVDIQGFMRNGRTVLEEFAGWLGGIIGGLFGGIADGYNKIRGNDGGGEGILESLPKRLTEFVEGLEPFLEKVANIKPDGAEALLLVLESMAAALGVEVLDVIVSFLNGGIFTGKSGIKTFSEKLKSFADAIVEFSDKVDGKVNLSAVRSSANAGKMLAALADAIPNSGGLSGLIFGNNNIDKFGSRLQAFAEGICTYSGIVTKVPINETAVESSVRAGKMLTALEDTIPNSGGLSWLIFGDNKLDKFGSRLQTFAEGICTYSQVVTRFPINESAVESSVRAGKILAALEGDVENTGGLSWLIFGDNRLDDFGKRLKSFGESIVDFSEAVDGKIKWGGVVAAKYICTIFNELEGSLGDADGLIDFFIGNNDIDDFGTRLENFAGSLVRFSAILNGELAEGITGYTGVLNAEVIDGAIDTIQKIADFTEMFSGENVNSVYQNLTGLEGVEVVILEHLKSLTQKLDDSNYDFSEAYTGIAQKFADGLSEAIQNALTSTDETSNMQVVAESISNALADKQLLSDVRKNSESLAKEIIDALTDITGENGDLGEFTAEVTEVFNTMLSTVVEAIKNKSSEILDAGKQWANALATGLRTPSAITVIRAAASNLGSTAVSALRTHTDQFRTLGSNAASGFATGISSGTSAVTTAANNMGTAAGKTSSNSLQAVWQKILSGDLPQGDVAVQIGNRMGEALAEGITDSADKGTTAFTDSVATMASYANAVMNEALDTNPVITPVLDMSNIQPGMIDNYLGTSDIDVNTKGASSYTTGLLSGVGGTNTSNLQARLNNIATMNTLNGIRSDIKDLGDSMSHMQMVMNGGALVGQIGTTMDRQLGSIQRFKERWA